MWKKLQRIIAHNILLPTYYKTQACTYMLCSLRFLRTQSLQQGSAPEGAHTGAPGLTWHSRASWPKKTSHQSGAGNLYFRYHPNHTFFFFVSVAEMWPTAFESFYETEARWDLVFWGASETQDSNWLWLSLAFQRWWYRKDFLHFFACTEFFEREWRPPKNVQLQANGCVEDEVHSPMYEFLNTQMSLSRREGKGRFGY